MKNALTAVVMAAFLITVGKVEAWCSTYSTYGKILQTVGSITLIMDTDGDIWELENNPLPDGTQVKIVFHDNLTPNYIYDDVIKEVTIIEAP